MNVVTVHSAFLCVYSTMETHDCYPKSILKLVNKPFTLSITRLNQIQNIDSINTDITTLVLLIKPKHTILTNHNVNNLFTSWMLKLITKDNYLICI